MRKISKSYLYEWLMAEGDHVYNASLSIGGKYVVDSYYDVKEETWNIVLSESDKGPWCNEDIPCLFNSLPLDETVIEIECTPFWEDRYAPKKITFRGCDIIDNIVVNPFNAVQLSDRN